MQLAAISFSRRPARLWLSHIRPVPHNHRSGLSLGYEALVWASAAAYVFASGFLWVILWALLSLRADQRQIYVRAPRLLFASFLCLLIHETVFFSLCVGVSYLDEAGLWRNWKSACGSLARAACRSVAVGVIYELTKPAVPIYTVTHLRH